MDLRKVSAKFVRYINRFSKKDKVLALKYLLHRVEDGNQDSACVVVRPHLGKDNPPITEETNIRIIGLISDKKIIYELSSRYYGGLTFYMSADRTIHEHKSLQELGKENLRLSDTLKQVI